jgi:ATP-dependent exoDNAse (exonuclease V) beta subunit
MTIHKSKGLEFDTVILPGLGSKAANQDKPLLRWLSLPSADNTALLLSPIHAKHQEKCPLYDYLGEIALEKEQYEQQRLLYVAVTRAKKRLYLMDGHDKIRKESFRDLLGEEPFENPTNSNNTDPNDHLSECEEETNISVTLSRLNISHYPKWDDKSFQNTANNEPNPLPELISPKTRIIGIASHELLAWICTTHITQINKLPWGMVENRLKRAGFNADEQQEAFNLIQNQISALLEDPIGQWICKPHKDEHNEYELLVPKNNETITRIIDRTFISDGKRWIIDFKTGAHAPASEIKHRKQVNEYANILSSQNHPICCGLYYLTGNHWVHWNVQLIENAENVM